MSRLYGKLTCIRTCERAAYEDDTGRGENIENTDIPWFITEFYSRSDRRQLFISWRSLWNAQYQRGVMTQWRRAWLWTNIQIALISRLRFRQPFRSSQCTWKYLPHSRRILLKEMRQQVCGVMHRIDNNNIVVVNIWLSILRIIPHIAEYEHYNDVGWEQFLPTITMAYWTGSVKCGVSLIRF